MIGELKFVRIGGLVFMASAESGFFITENVLKIYIWLVENEIENLFEVDGCQIEMAVLGKNREEILESSWHKIIIEFYNEDDASYFMLRWG